MSFIDIKHDLNIQNKYLLNQIDKTIFYKIIKILVNELVLINFKIQYNLYIYVSSW